MPRILTQSVMYRASALIAGHYEPKFLYVLAFSSGIQDHYSSGSILVLVTKQRHASH